MSENKTEMTDKQFENLCKMIKHEAGAALDAFIEAEVEADPDPERRAFLRDIQESDFFRGMHERGFTAGAYWQRQNKDTKYIL